MRDITYPPIIVTAKLGFRAARASASTWTGTEHVPRTGGVLLAVNHVGYVDFVYGGLAANPSGRKVRFMAKRELFDHRWPGPLMRSLHHIEVDRGAGVASYRTAVDYLRAGEAVGIFPEATISRAMELKELKTGAVRIAAEAGVPLVPVVLWGTQRMMTKDHPRDFSRGKHHRDPGRGAAAPDRRRPGRGDRRAQGARWPALLDDAIRAYPAERAAARVVVGARSGTAASAPTLEEAAGSTPRSSAAARRQRDGARADDRQADSVALSTNRRVGYGDHMVRSAGRVRLRGSMTSTIRRRSSSEANSTVILPLVWPRSTLTRVSSRSESRSASSVRPGRDRLAPRRARRRRRRRSRRPRRSPRGRGR